MERSDNGPSPALLKRYTGLRKQKTTFETEFRFKKQKQLGSLSKGTLRRVSYCLLITIWPVDTNWKKTQRRRSKNMGVWDHLRSFGRKVVDVFTGNETAKDIAKQTNETNYRIWSEQRADANTAHQREIADLKAAGLNPLLTVTGGSGAQSPAGPTAVGRSYTPPFAGVQALGSTAKTAADTYATLLNYQRARAEIKNIDADTQSKTTQNAYQPELLRQQIRQNEEQIQSIRASTDLSRQQKISMEAQVWRDNAELELKQIHNTADVERLSQQSALLREQVEAGRITNAQALAEFIQRVEAGGFSPNDYWVKQLSPGVSDAEIIRGQLRQGGRGLSSETNRHTVDSANKLLGAKTTMDTSGSAPGGGR